MKNIMIFKLGIMHKRLWVKPKSLGEIRGWGWGWIVLLQINTIHKPNGNEPYICALNFFFVSVKSGKYYPIEYLCSILLLRTVQGQSDCMKKSQLERDTFFE